MEEVPEAELRNLVAKAEALRLLPEERMSEKIGRCEGRVDPAAEAHGLRRQEHVLKQEIGLDVGAERAERARAARGCPC